MSEGRAPLRLFEGYGVELEYMIVREEDLSVLPVSDRVLEALAGEIVNEIEVESVSWSNELVMHLIELKNTDPSPELVPLGSLFHEHVERLAPVVEGAGGVLLPSGMHPFMRPREETRLWPHEGREIYETFDRIFDCRRHGWANVQSVQLNLSFGDDEEFGRLHAAIRVLLPVMAGLAASSPVAEGEITGLLDNRLEAYRTNSLKIPSITGRVIPELVFTRTDYDRLFEQMYEDIAPHDPEGTLRHHWLNARGAIAQFVRDAIEIRVLDMQECPQADIAICAAITAVLKALVEERWAPGERQRSWDVEPLVEIFLATLKDGEQAVLRDRDYLETFGFPGRDGTVQDLWTYLVETLRDGENGLDSPHLKSILEKGPLARRMLRVLGTSPRREEIELVYRALLRCLAEGTSFVEP